MARIWICCIGIQAGKISLNVDKLYSQIILNCKTFADNVINQEYFFVILINLFFIQGKESHVDSKAILCT